MRSKSPDGESEQLVFVYLRNLKGQLSSVKRIFHDVRHDYGGNRKISGVMTSTEMQNIADLALHTILLNYHSFLTVLDHTRGLLLLSLFLLIEKAVILKFVRKFARVNCKILVRIYSPFKSYRFCLFSLLHL